MLVSRSEPVVMRFEADMVVVLVMGGVMELEDRISTQSATSRIVASHE